MTADKPVVGLPGGVSWLDTCYPMERQHHHISPYLLEGPDGTVLIEAGSIEHQDQLVERIEALLGSEGIDAAILSHYDLPHVANARAFRDRWDFDLYTSFSGTSANPETLGMGPSTGCMHEETREICGRTFTFPWPPLVDAAHTMWVYDHEAKVMFTGDMGHYHEPGACRQVIDQESEMVTIEEIRAYNEDALPFTKYLDPAKMRAAFAEMREQYDVEIWAPVHGNPIVGSSLIELYHDRYVEAIAATHDAATR
jgi:flavorubredoxin